MHRCVFPALVLSLSALSLPAQPVPDYGLQWCTVGAPGNRGTLPHETLGWGPGPFGRVDYAYRMTRTEITTGQWLEFVNAYSPYWTGATNDLRFTSSYVWHIGNGVYAAPAGALNYPADMSWEMAARYCNWLHNGKGTEQEAFEGGVYDTSGFNGTDTHDVVRAPDARFWIPSLDEWVKAVYYDPHRYGPGEEGYWRHPGSTDDILISGYPDQGGQTSGGITGLFRMDVGSYPDTQSPWGLLDASGGVKEWTEFRWPTTSQWSVGSETGFIGYFAYDELGGVWSGGGGTGLRLASAVPAPPAWGMLASMVWLSRRRRM